MGFHSKLLLYVLKNSLHCFTNNEMMYFLDKELEKDFKSMNGDLITLLLDCMENNKKKSPQYRFINTSEKNHLSQDKYIFFDKTTDFEIYAEDLDVGESFDCCNKNEIQGIKLIIDNRILSVCKQHLFALLDFFNEILEKIEETQSAVISLYGIEFVAETGCLIFIRKSVYKYLYNLFKQHNDDQLFENKELSDNQKKVVSIFQYDESEEKKYKNNSNNFSQGELQCYLNRKHILKRLQDCVKYNKKLSIPYEYVIQRPVRSLKVFYSIRNIECMSNKHNYSKDAVIVLSSYRNDTFTFSFCENCLYDLFVILEKAYSEKEVNTIKQNNYQLIYKESDDYCFFTGIKEEKMYEIHLVNIYFVICRLSLEMLFETIISSSAFAEIYPKIYKRYIPLIKEIQQQYQCKRIQKVFENKLKQKDMIIDRLYEVVEDKNVELSLYKAYQKAKENEVEDKPSNSFASKYKDKVLNCLQSGNVINLGIPVNRAKKNKVQELNVTIVNGINCCTFNHYPRNELVAIVEIDRKYDKFCFAMCLECLRIALYGLEHYLKNKTNYYGDNNFSIIQVNSTKNEHCYFCGGNNKIVRIMFGIVQFELCESCLQILKKELEKASIKLDALRKLGGYEFFKNKFVNLKEKQ